MRPFTQAIHKVNRSHYQLPTAGVVGLLFGGDAAVDALTTIHLYAGRRWVGWYNYPGPQSVAMRFGQMAKTRWWDSLFPGPNDPPAVTFGLAAESGPRYSGSFSGTELTKTQYLGHLAADECTSCLGKELKLFDEHGDPARETKSTPVTIIYLPPKQHERIKALKSHAVSGVGATKLDPGRVGLKPKDDILPLCAIGPSLVSIAACVLCLLGDDPLSAALILFGIVNGGISSIVLGTASLWIRVPVPSNAAPVGDGLIYAEDGSIIILKGEEADVNIITKGEFELDFSAAIWADENYHAIGVVSFFLLAQSLLQLLLLSSSSLFSQVMFLASLIASGSYHLYVVSNQKEKVHRELLFKQLGARPEKLLLGTRTQMAVFVCLCVGDGLWIGDDRRDPLQVKYKPILLSIIPNDTPVWNYWRKKVLRELEHFWKSDRSSYVPSIYAEPTDKAQEDEYQGFEEEDKRLLHDLISDAWCVFHGYPSWKSEESNTWHGQAESTEEKVLLPQGESAV